MSSRCTMPGRSGAHDPCGHQVAPGRGSVTAGRRRACPRGAPLPGAPRGPRACPRRPPRGPRRRPRTARRARPRRLRRPASGNSTVSVLPSWSTARPSRGRRAVDQDPAGLHQRSGLPARDVGHHRHPPIDPEPRHEGRHLRGDRLPGPRRHRLSCVAAAPRAHAALPWRASARPPKRRVAITTTTPTVTQASATLNVGQKLERDEVGHPPPVAAHDPLAQVPDGTAQHETGADGQGHGADLGHDEGQDHDTDAEEDRDQRRPAR